MIGSSVMYYKMVREPIEMFAQQEKHMDYDQIELRNKAVSLIVEMYFCHALSRCFTLINLPECEDWRYYLPHILARARV